MAAKGIAVAFPGSIAPPASVSSKPLVLVGHGVTDMTLETIEVKLTEMAVYVDPDIAKHMQAWKGKTKKATGATLDGNYADSFVAAPVEKLVQVRIIKTIRGSVYGGGLESSIRDRLAYDYKYEDEESSALEAVASYLGTKNLPAHASILFHWPSPSVVRVTASEEGSEPTEMEQICDNENVSKCLLHWTIGEEALSESTALFTAKGVAILCEQSQ